MNECVAGSCRLVSKILLLIGPPDTIMSRLDHLGLPSTVRYNDRLSSLLIAMIIVWITTGSFELLDVALVISG